MGRPKKVNRYRFTFLGHAPRGVIGEKQGLNFLVALFVNSVLGVVHDGT